MLKTVKFGGSSLADAEHFNIVKNIVSADAGRRVVIVSAPGKRKKNDNKITDLLYLCYAHVKYGVDYENIMNMIKERYASIIDEAGIDFDIDAAFDKIKTELAGGADEDYLVSRGEALCAEIMAKYLDFDFVDAINCVPRKYRYPGILRLNARRQACAYVARRLGYYGRAGGGGNRRGHV